LDEGLLTQTAHPTILSHQNVNMGSIEDVQIVYVNDRSSKQEKVAELTAAGYKTMTISIIRNDFINYGINGVSAVQHVFAIVMVKLKKSV